MVASLWKPSCFGLVFFHVIVSRLQCKYVSFSSRPLPSRSLESVGTPPIEQFVLTLPLHGLIYVDTPVLHAESCNTKSTQIFAILSVKLPSSLLLLLLLVIVVEYFYYYTINTTTTTTTTTILLYYIVITTTTTTATTATSNHTVSTVHDEG